MGFEHNWRSGSDGIFSFRVAYFKDIHSMPMERRQEGLSNAIGKESERIGNHDLSNAKLERESNQVQALEQQVSTSI
jgi:hypothetical protein